MRVARAVASSSRAFAARFDARRAPAAIAIKSTTTGAKMMRVQMIMFVAFRL